MHCPLSAALITKRACKHQRVNAIDDDPLRRRHSGSLAICKHRTWKSPISSLFLLNVRIADRQYAQDFCTNSIQQLLMIQRVCDRGARTVVRILVINWSPRCNLGEIESGQERRSRTQLLRVPKRKKARAPNRPFMMDDKW